MNKLKSASNESLLRRYLSGEVGPREEAELRARARKDEALAEALVGIDARPEEDHLVVIERLRTKLPRAQATQRQLAFSWQRMAAALALLLLASTAIWYLPQALGPSEATALDYATEADEAETIVPESETVTEENSSTSGPEQSPPSPTIQLEQETMEEVFDETRRNDRLEQTQNQLAEETDIQGNATTANQPQDDLQRSDESALADHAAGGSPSPQYVPAESTAAASPEPVMALTEEDFSPPAPRADIPTASGRLAGESRESADVAFAPSTSDAGPETTEYLVDGYVVDPQGVPISGALVRLPGLPLGEVTDGDGYFNFEGDASVSILIIEAPGFAEADFRLAPVEVPTPMGTETRARRQMTREELFQRNLQAGDPASQEIVPTYRLEPLPELAVDDDLTSGTTIYPNALPPMVRVEGGMRALRENILSEKPADLGEGRIRVSFSVQPDGSLTDFMLRGGTRELRRYVEMYLQQQTVWRMIRGEEATDISFVLRF